MPRKCPAAQENDDQLTTQTGATSDSVPCAAGVTSCGKPRLQHSNIARPHRRQVQSPILCREGEGGHQHAAFVFCDDSVYNGAKRIDEPLVRALLPVLKSTGNMSATTTYTVIGARDGEEGRSKSMSAPTGIVGATKKLEPAGDQHEPSRGVGKPGHLSDIWFTWT